MSKLVKRLIIFSFFTFAILVGVTAKDKNLIIDSTPEAPQTEAADSPMLIQEQASLRSLDFHHRLSRDSAVKVHKLAQLPTQDRAHTMGHGSGTYFKFQGSYYILTAKHVVDNEAVLLISSENSFSTIAHTVYVSENYDIAVLSVPRMRNLTPVSLDFKDVEDWLVGSEVVYTGYPSSYNLLTSTGIVSGTATNYNNSILVQGFVWPGSSGAGVFDSSGNLTGLVWALGVESFAGRPQALETLVYICPLTRSEVRRIKDTLRSL